MATLTESSLTEDERRALDLAVSELRREFGERLRSVWLYGSRARGEPRHPESDVDLLVVLDHENWREARRVFEVVGRAEEAVGLDRMALSAQVYDIERIAQRREIKSFFIQEVDRDKIVLFGEP